VFLIAYYRGHIHLRQHYIMHVLRRTHLSKIEYRSLIVFGVPKDLRHEVELAAFFEGLGVGRVENAVICRKWTKLREAVRRRAEALYNLERIYNDVRRSGGGSWLANRSASPPYTAISRRFSASEASDDASLSIIMSYLQAVDPRLRPKHRVSQSLARAHESDDDGAALFSPVLPHGNHELTTTTGGRTRGTWRRMLASAAHWFEPTVVVDSANFWAAEFRIWDARVAALRKVPETSPSTAVGFVTFESPQSATIASQIILNRRPFSCMAKMAPEPRDIYWPNLSSRAADSPVKFIRTATVHTVSTVIILFSTIFSVLVVAPLLTLKNLNQVPFLKELFERLGAPAQHFVEQVIPITLFATWTSSLPSLLIETVVLSKFQGLEAESWIDMAVFSK
ncbi:hypothetical protein HK405_002663, partial [Cladochytrium tenue]